MADVATVFHWSTDVMDRYSVPELMRWHTRALDRFKAQHSTRKAR